MSTPHTIRNLPLIALINGLFGLYCFFAVVHLTGKAGLPESSVSSYPIYINGTTISNPDDLEFFAALQQRGATVDVVPGGSDTQARAFVLGAYYSGPSIATSSVIALIVYGFGLMVFLFRRDDDAARIFHFGTILVSSALIGVKTMTMMKPYWLGFTTGGWFFLAYTAVAVCFLHFSFLFPSVRFAGYRRVIIPLYVVAVLLGGFYHYNYVEAVIAQSPGLFDRALVIASVQNLFIFLVFIAGFANLIISYRSTQTNAERRKLRWILFGLTLGPAPFIFLWVLPQVFRIDPFVPELAFKVALLLVPATFSIAIVRHRALDIDLLINRSLVYGIVIGLFVMLYMAIVGVAARYVTVWSAQSSLTISIIIAVATALLFDPLRKRLQQTIDRSFFRIEYDFREAQRELSQAILDCVDESEIAAKVVSTIQALVPVERIGFFFVERERLRVLAHEHFDMLEGHSIPLEIAKISADLRKPIAQPGAVEAGIEFGRGDEQVLSRWGMVLILPMLFRSGEIVGFLVFGKKKSGMRFAFEDVDLLNGLAAQAALALERLALQQKLMLEHAEAERLAELSATKSYFISSVSHDLKTPLTSIRIFTELLEGRKELDPADRTKYLRIIRSETDRLSRLINNVLDFSRVERGVKEYSMAEIELNEVIDHVITSMQYQFSTQHCTVETQLSSDPIFLNADRDALMELLDNLFSNALRYTPAEKQIAVTSRIDGDTAVFSVQDNGIGMTAQEINQLGVPFFRTEAAKGHGKGGTGLGLSVVKHIVTGHRGSLEITSEPGRGSIFSVRLPLS